MMNNNLTGNNNHFKILSFAKWEINKGTTVSLQDNTDRSITLM